MAVTLGGKREPQVTQLVSKWTGIPTQVGASDSAWSVFSATDFVRGNWTMPIFIHRECLFAHSFQQIIIFCFLTQLVVYLADRLNFKHSPHPTY